jgi:hemerythrin superfamily protein
MALTDTIADVVDSAKDLLHRNDSEEADANKHEQNHGDVLDVLREDHRRVEALFKEILAEKSSTLANQRKNIEKVLAELTLHAKVEETIVYPAVYGKTKRDTDERLEVLEAYEEHGSMKDLMKKIAKTTGRDESLKAKVQVLMEITEHHVKEEESTFFPEARKLLGEKRLKQIGAEVLKVKERAAKRNAPKPAKTRAKKTSAREPAVGKKRSSKTG